MANNDYFLTNSTAKQLCVIHNNNRNQKHTFPFHIFASAKYVRQEYETLNETNFLLLNDDEKFFVLYVVLWRPLKVLQICIEVKR